ncbi:hypothetical protein GQ42DRAFT_3285 [Ramicandelaber brevisporus]|nr:hypothetical protein GQ42DRAFT_3285 [Ramicandelaber brevisporus]
MMTTKRVCISEAAADLAANHFRLLDLPFDLRECVSQFVDRRTAARLLTLSSGCHELFARSVWRCINESIFNNSASDETRTSAFVRYGRFVRRVHLQGPLDGLDYNIDLSQLLPNVTVYKFEVGTFCSNKKQALHLIQAVSGLHGLRSLEVAVGTNYHQFCLEPLADALVSRQQNHNWQRLKRLKLEFLPRSYHCQWADIADLVSKVTPLQIDDFDITMNGSTSENPTAEQMALVGPHITSSPNVCVPESPPQCNAHLNRIVYSPPALSGNDGSVVFSRLESLRVSLCCASSAVYDYADFTAVKFPRIETLVFHVTSCDQDTMSRDLTFVHPALSQCWPTVSTMNLYGITATPALYTLLDHNPQITNLSVETASSGTNNDQSSYFCLVDIVKRLPMLETLYISSTEQHKFHGNSENNASGNEDGDLLHLKDSRLTYIRFSSLVLTSGCLEMLYMLPNLEDIMITRCNLDDPEAALEKVTRIQQLNSTMESGKYGASIQRIQFEKVGFSTHDYWSVELAVAIVAAAPSIRSIKFDDVTRKLVSAITKRFPNVGLRYKYVCSGYGYSDDEPSDDDDDDDDSSGESSDDTSDEETSDD